MSKEKEQIQSQEKTKRGWHVITIITPALVLALAIILSSLYLGEKEKREKLQQEKDKIEQFYKETTKNDSVKIARLTQQIKKKDKEIWLTSVIHRDLLPYGVEVTNYVSYLNDSTKSASSYVENAVYKVGKDIDLAQDRIRDVLYAAKKLGLEKTFAKILAKGIAWTKSLPWSRAALKDTVVFIDQGDGQGYEFPCKVFIDDSLDKNSLWPERAILRNPNLYNKFLQLADSVGRQLVGGGTWGEYLSQEKTDTKPVVVPSTPTPKTATVIKKQKTKKQLPKRKFRRLPRRR